MLNKEILKKQIIYRSKHRGSKEMDILLGKFVQRHIDRMNINDLVDLDSILNIEDEILYHWYFYKINNNLIPDNKVSELLKIFKV